MKKYGLFTIGVLLLVILGAIYYWFWLPAKTTEKKEDPLPRDQVTIYFLDRETGYLTPVDRQVPEAADQPDRVKQIIEQLSNEPGESNHVRLLPEKIALRAVYLDGQTVYIDFNDKLVGAAQGSSGEMMLLYSIVNSVLKNLSSDYKLVKILIEGESRKTIGAYGEESGHIAIKYPLGPRWNLADTSA